VKGMMIIIVMTETVLDMIMPIGAESIQA